MAKKIHPKDRALAVIERLWGDAPVIDAKVDLRLIPIQDDVTTAKKSDPGWCVFANTCRRVLHCQKVLIFRTVAYVEMPPLGNEGHRIERFRLSDSARDLIDKFDKGEPLVGGKEFVLRAPTKSLTLESRRKKELKMNGSKRREERRRRREAVLKGTSTGIGRGNGVFRDEPLLLDAQRRIGQGMVQFTREIKRLPKVK